MHNFHETYTVRLPKLKACRSGVKPYVAIPEKLHQQKYSAINSSDSKSIPVQHKYQAYSPNYQAGVKPYRAMPEIQLEKQREELKLNLHFSAAKKMKVEWQLQERPVVGVKRLTKVIVKISDYIKRKWEMLFKRPKNE